MGRLTELWHWTLGGPTDHYIVIMISHTLCLALLVAVAYAEPKTRQLPTCTNAFVLASNPCASGAGRTYYPVPNDNTKFVQCDILGGAYVVQCPQHSSITPCVTHASCRRQ